MNKTKYFVLFLILSSGIFSCGKITDTEASLGKEAGLKEEDLLFIKDVTKSEIDKISTPGDTIKGIKVSVPYDKTGNARKELRAVFKPKGYQVFIAGFFNDPGRNNIIGIIRSGDQFDIVRVQKTKPSRKKYSTEDIVNRLIDWNKDFKFEITRAGEFWIDANFITKPADMNKFARELTKFCPEILNDGTGKIEDVINGMISSNSFSMIF
jgi:hypothetical protein